MLIGGVVRRGLEIWAPRRYTERMAEPASIFDLVDDDAKRRAIAEARASVAAGRFVDHTLVAEWLEKLASGEQVPAPLSTRPRE